MQPVSRKRMVLDYAGPQMSTLEYFKPKYAKFTILYSLPTPWGHAFIPLTASEYTPHFCKTQSQTSSLPLPHQPSFKSRMIMLVPTHFVLRGPIHLLCSQFLLENGKTHHTREEDICWNSAKGNFWKHHFFLAYDPGAAVFFSLSRSWLERICCFCSCQVHLTVFVLVFHVQAAEGRCFILLFSWSQIPRRLKRRK